MAHPRKIGIDRNQPHRNRETDMAKFVAMGIESVEPEEYRPDKDSVISGNPRFRLWSLDEAKGGLSSGIWEATPGKWRFENTHWEFCRILAGVSIITEDGA
jgi:uncharacterized protein